MTKPRRRLEVRGNYDAPVDATYVVKPVVEPDILPNLVFSPLNNPNFTRVGVGYNMNGQLIDYNNNGKLTTVEEGREKIKKAWKNPRIKATEDILRDIALDAYRSENKYKDGGIYIKPSKRGTFTAAATKHGMSVQEFASKVLRNKENYSPSLVKKANFARNASKWH